jgi:hypothetical protein
MPSLSFDLTFLGTGVSHSIPKLDHALDLTACAVCADAVAGGLLSKNRRNNVSACIRFFDSSLCAAAPSQYAVAVIDVGKTFRDSVLSWMGGLHVAQIDSVLISHKHADAIGGLDDLRDMQRIQVAVDAVSGLSTHTTSHSLNLIADADCLWSANGISTRFAYLSPPGINAAPSPCHLPVIASCPSCLRNVDASSSTAPMVKPVANLTWWCLQYFKPFYLHGITVQAVPLLHGRSDGQLCSGFVFNGGSLVWLSDVVELPEGMRPPHTFIPQPLPRQRCSCCGMLARFPMPNGCFIRQKVCVRCKV